MPAQLDFARSTQPSPRGRPLSSNGHVLGRPKPSTYGPLSPGLVATSLGSNYHARLGALASLRPLLAHPLARHSAGACELSPILVGTVADNQRAPAPPAREDTVIPEPVDGAAGDDGGELLQELDGLEKNMRRPIAPHMVLSPRRTRSFARVKRPPFGSSPGPRASHRPAPPACKWDRRSGHRGADAGGSHRTPAAHHAIRPSRATGSDTIHSPPSACSFPDSATVPRRARCRRALFRLVEVEVERSASRGKTGADQPPAGAPIHQCGRA
jgi:hypothetical protein